MAGGASCIWPSPLSDDGIAAIDTPDDPIWLGIPIASRDRRDSPVKAGMSALSQALKIVDMVVRLIVVFVVDFIAIQHRAVMEYPDLSMKAKSALRPDRLVRALVVGAAPLAVAMPALAVPFDAAIAHAVSPIRRRSILVQPDLRYTGWSEVPTKNAPFPKVTRPTTLLRTEFATTGRGPRLVSTMSPGRSVSIGTLPFGVATIVPATKHHPASCCGPRNRSGSSAENSVATAPLAQVTRRFDGS